MSCEPLSMSRERKRAFRAGKFPEDLITKDMIREMTHTIECPPGSPNYREFRVTEGMLLINVPAWMSPPIEYCDHLLKINETPITSKRELHDVLKKIRNSKKNNFVEFRVRRVISVERITNDKLIPRNAACFKPSSMDPNAKPCTGYTYYKIVLIFFPRSQLGMNIKSYQNVVYVESTDNTWGSTTRRFLYVGDAILKIDDTEILDLKSTQTALRNGLHKNGIVTMIVERAVQQMASNFVRSVLSYCKNLDPQLPQDMILICKQRLAHLEKNGFGAEPVGIWRGTKNCDYSKQGRVKVTNKVRVNNIRAECLNPATLQAVPDYKNVQQ